MKNSGITKIESSPALTKRTRSGTTPGGRSYSSTRVNSSTSGVTKNTKVRSGLTTWGKHSGPDGSDKVRSVGSGTKFDVKGPTKAKAGFGKTHTFSSGTKIRSGTTPGGKKYKSIQHPSGYKSTTVGGFQKTTKPARSAPPSPSSAMTKLLGPMISSSGARPKSVSKTSIKTGKPKI